MMILQIELNDWLVTSTRIVAFSAALGAACAQAQDMGKPGTLATPAADEALVSDLPENLARLPAPAIAPPVNRKKPAKVKIELEAKPVTGLLAEGVGYHYWT
ncbi:MAG: hypothetical protein ACRECP_02880 [Methylocella sp.]